MIDPTFRNINRLFVLSFINGDNGPTRNSCIKYNMPLVEVKGFNALIDNKIFFNQVVKHKQESYEKVVQMPKKDNYIAGKLLHFSYYQNYYKFFGLDLSRQKSTSTSQKINFLGKLEEGDGATMLFITEKQKKSYFEFLVSFIKRKKII